MSFELPLFPLNVVLFPGMQLPLHIFEPRYRAMIARCLEGDSTFGVALLVEGEEGQPDTIPAVVGCTAQIIESLPFPDGRLNLMTVGKRRFEIVSMRGQDDYLIGTCRWLDDQAPPMPAADSPEEAFRLMRNSIRQRAARVRHALKGYLASLARNAHLEPSDLESMDVPHDPYRLSMWVASLLTLPNEQKQELLEMTSTPARLEIENVFLRRGEIVQRAYERRVRESAFLAPPAEGEPEADDGPFSQFISPN